MAQAAGKVKRVCLVSSGTGGHLMPAVALARALESRGHRTALLTEGRAVENALLDRLTDPRPASGSGPAAGPARGPANGPFDGTAEDGRIDASQLHVGGPVWSLPLRLAQATIQARRFYRRHEVDLVVGAGGRTTVPAAIAARTLGVPLFLLEQNVVTGRSNRMLMPFAERIYYGLPPSRPCRRGLVTGTPLRPQVGGVDRRSARRSLGLSEDRPVVLVTGGSQGAQVLNDTVPAAMAGLGTAVQIVHLAGEHRDAGVRARYHGCEGVTALVWPMVMDMASLYAAADLVICRGGGGTVAELMTVGRASIIVPYPYHRDRQQWHNGRVLSAAGAALLIDEVDLEVAELSRLLGDLLSHPTKLAAMGAKARALAPEDPCEQILSDMSNLGALD